MTVPAPEAMLSFSPGAKRAAMAGLTRRMSATPLVKRSESFPGGALAAMLASAAAVKSHSEVKSVFIIGTRRRVLNECRSGCQSDRTTQRKFGESRVESQKQHCG